MENRNYDIRYDKYEIRNQSKVLTFGFAEMKVIRSNK